MYLCAQGTVTAFNGAASGEGEGARPVRVRLIQRCPRGEPPPAALPCDPCPLDCPATSQSFQRALWGSAQRQGVQGKGLGPTLQLDNDNLAAPSITTDSDPDGMLGHRPKTQAILRAAMFIRLGESQS